MIKDKRDIFTQLRGDEKVIEYRKTNKGEKMINKVKIERIPDFVKRAIENKRECEYKRKEAKKIVKGMDKEIKTFDQIIEDGILRILDER